jgi:TMEM175 potassium channel family protein
MTEPELQRQSAPSEVLVEMGRLKALSDGVVAFALTLLVLDIRVPTGLTASDLPQAILALWPRFLVYLISFVVIGGAWGAHQRMLGQISRGGGLLVWFTLMFLLPITLVPAVAALLGEHPTDFLAIALFALDAIAIQLASWLLWRHASNNGLVDASLDPRVVAAIGRRLLLSAFGFAVSIPLALVSPLIAYLVWIVVFALVFATDWLSWRIANRSAQLRIPLEGAKQARIIVQNAAGLLKLDATDDPDVLVQGTFGGGVDPRVKHEDGIADIDLRAIKYDYLSARFPWTWGSADLLDWVVGLSPDIPISLTVDNAAGDARLALSRLKVPEVTIQIAAGTLELTLPQNAGHTSVKIDGSASSIVVHVPRGVAAAIQAEQTLGGVVVDVVRFPEIVSQHLYRSPDYDEAVNRVDIHARMSLGSIQIGD